MPAIAPKTIAPKTITSKTIASMTIAELARASGADIKSIRSYEEHGFLSRSASAPDGDPPYRESDVATVVFALRARGLGFSLEATGELLMLAQRPPGHGCADVYEVIERQLDDIRRRMGELAHFERLLSPLAVACPRRGGIEDCPVVATLKQPV